MATIILQYLREVYIATSPEICLFPLFTPDVAGCGYNYAMYPYYLRSGYPGFYNLSFVIVGRDRIVHYALLDYNITLKYIYA